MSTSNSIWQSLWAYVLNNASLKILIPSWLKKQQLSTFSLWNPETMVILDVKFEPFHANGSGIEVLEKSNKFLKRILIRSTYGINSDSKCERIKEYQGGKTWVTLWCTHQVARLVANAKRQVITLDLKSRCLIRQFNNRKQCIFWNMNSLFLPVCKIKLNFFVNNSCKQFHMNLQEFSSCIRTRIIRNNAVSMSGSKSLEWACTWLLPALSAKFGIPTRWRRKNFTLFWLLKTLPQTCRHLDNGLQIFSFEFTSDRPQTQSTITTTKRKRQTWPNIKSANSTFHHVGHPGWGSCQLAEQTTDLVLSYYTSHAHSDMSTDRNTQNFPCCQCICQLFLFRLNNC